MPVKGTYSWSAVRHGEEAVLLRRHPFCGEPPDVSKVPMMEDTAFKNLEWRHAYRTLTPEKGAPGLGTLRRAWEVNSRTTAEVSTRRAPWKARAQAFLKGKKSSRRLILCTLSHHARTPESICWCHVWSMHVTPAPSVTPVSVTPDAVCACSSCHFRHARPPAVKQSLSHQMQSVHAVVICVCPEASHDVAMRERALIPCKAQPVKVGGSSGSGMHRPAPPPPAPPPPLGPPSGPPP